ncbi:hypothetical protein TNCV_3235551 [Trichonephila clavipes]|nr:hypothetical protein TNCV_3235551 [Trichonephila clavipes]
MFNIQVQGVCDFKYPRVMAYSYGITLQNKEFLCLDNEHIFGGDQGCTPEIIDVVLTTARDLELEVNEDDIEELLMGHEDELTTEELQEILNEEHQEKHNEIVSF